MPSPSRAPRSRTAKAAVAVLCAMTLWSCRAQTVDGFQWTDHDGKAMAFIQSGRMPEGEEGSFSGPAANRYILVKPVELASGRSIAVDVEPVGVDASGGRPKVTLGVSSEPDGDPIVVEATFPILAGRARFYLRATEHSRIASISAKSQGEGAFKIIGISMPVAIAGMRAGSEGLSVSSGFKLAVGRGSQESTIESPFAGLASSAGSAADGTIGLVISYGPSKDGTYRKDGISLTATRAGGGEASINLRIGPGGRRTVLDMGLFPPDTTRLVARASEGVAIDSFFAASLGPDDYELADLSRVIASGAPRDGSDFALFKWDALPSVVVLVFKDYDTQDRYLKRLAFFVEKAGYRGTLQKDEVIEPLHGWNAHDYRPEDLAAFFEKASAVSFPLSIQERSLEKLLIARGILREEEGKVGPGTGALLSVSLETEQNLRRTLLVHESTHAIFFADEEYRAFVRKIWSSLSDDEKWFWKAYFSWAMYDTGSDYLMANEFQAYLMQQPTSSAMEYFTVRKADELLAKHPELEARVDAYMKRYGASFEARARDVEAWLARRYGFSAGKTYFLDLRK
jgi:hypothetical protein